VLACLCGTVCRSTATDRLAGCTLADIGADHPAGRRPATGCSEVGCRMSVVETAVPRKTFQRKCTGEPAAASLRLWCGVGDRRGGRFPLRFCRLGLLGSGRHLLRLRLRHDGRQLNGCGFANLNRDADDRRLVDRTSSGSESLRSLGRPATFGVVSSTSERVGVSGRSRRRFSSSARLSAACRRNCRTSD
jgi:hypothetical protein